ncbi:uncharacterized protein METZ01_LOCUS385998 [marine metagenome]|uniref:Uncharacterized protein n=1 Tax=marine metagenome TaxID=408172 RepID=A0A382UFU1_9ZZZZ
MGILDRFSLKGRVAVADGGWTTL